MKPGSDPFLTFLVKDLLIGAYSLSLFSVALLSDMGFFSFNQWLALIDLCGDLPVIFE